MMGDAKFIKTSDKETAEQLINLGFKLCSQSGNLWTFINDSKLSFSSKKAVYTNILSL